MTTEFNKDPVAFTDPPIYVSWRVYATYFDDQVYRDDGADYHLTNYQALAIRLLETQDANKASAHSNAELIDKLRKKIKKAKRALK